MSGYNTRNKKETITYEDLMNLLDDRLQNIATKECINDLKLIIENQQKTISKQQEEIDNLKGQVRKLQNENDEISQYRHRTCLRINGIPPSNNESGDECLEKVKNLIQDLGVEIPESCIDRAHRIGRAFKTKDGSSVHTVIVKFTTWRHRTLLFKARTNSICKEKKIKMYVDLTKRRVNILKEANKKIKDCVNIDYVFANINCQLCLKFKNSIQPVFFNDLDDLDVLLDHE